MNNSNISDEEVDAVLIPLRIAMARYKSCIYRLCIKWMMLWDNSFCYVDLKADLLKHIRRASPLYAYGVISEEQKQRILRALRKAESLLPDGIKYDQPD